MEFQKTADANSRRMHEAYQQYYSMRDSKRALHNEMQNETKLPQKYTFHNADEDSQVCAKKRRNFFTCFQKVELEEIFCNNSYPSRQTCELLARKFGTNPHSLKIWFKNRRARQKKTLSPGSGPSKQPTEDNSSQVTQARPQTYGISMYHPYFNDIPPHSSIQYTQFPALRKIQFGPRICTVDAVRRSAFSIYQKNIYEIREDEGL